jgi:hypothetical protein
MSWDEVCVRATQEAHKRWDLVRATLPNFVQRRADVRFGGTGRFFFQPADIPGIIEWLRTNLSGVSRRIVQDADRILEHKFCLLGYEEVQYDREIDWHFDAVHGKSSPRIAWFRVPFLDFDHVGDHKIIWELNRHQHLVTLAKAYRLTNKNSYATELFDQWYDWQQKNQYPTGINWASSLEVAFRSMSWLWVWHLLEGTAAVPARFPFDLYGALMQAGRYIERFLSTYFAPNTHLIGEAVALFFMGCLAPESRVTRRWQELGWGIILQQAKSQVLPDGMHFEQSTYYHVYALDFFIHARVLADRNGIAVPSEFDATIERMLNVLQVLGQSGSVPQFGDDDGGRVFDSGRNCRNHMFDPLATGALLFHRADLKTAVGAPTEESLWLFGKNGMQNFATLVTAEKKGSSASLDASGVYVMSGPEGQQLIIDAGPQGRGWAGHGHADALSVQLSIRNRQILVDPGTCSYVDVTGERDYFRATRSHSTVEIDGVSQAKPSGSFKWSNLAHASAERWITGEGFDFFMGSHGGYDRLESPVVHQRTVFYLKPQFWVVRDVLKGVGPHHIGISWNFAPGSLAALSDRAYFCGRDGAALTTLFSAHTDFSIAATDGWFSERYGHKEPSPFLRLRGKAQLPVECATLLLPSIDAAVRFAGIEADPQNQHARCVQGYRLSTSGRTHEMFFSDSIGNWTSGPIASDARFVYCSRLAGCAYDRFILLDGSFLELEEHRAFSSDARVESKEWCVPAQTVATDRMVPYQDDMVDVVAERVSPSI